MHWNPLRWDIDAAWLALKRLAAKSLMIIFGLRPFYHLGPWRFSSARKG